jgi:two-component system, NtrC family, sensor histidine kinase KinB
VKVAIFDFLSSRRYIKKNLKEMKAKDKLRFKLWTLFFLVILGGVLALFYMREISNNAKVLLEDNYNTLVYTREMRTVLLENPPPMPQQALKNLQQELVKEENNITELGEREVVQKLRQNVNVLANSSASLPQMQQAVFGARKAIQEIEQINLDAIMRKHQQAQSSIRRATIYLGLVGALTFLILFSFLFNLPDLVETSMKPEKGSTSENPQDFL